MLLQQLAEGFAQDAHAAAVDYADARESGEKCAVDELFYFAAGLVDGLADDVDLAGRIGAFVFERHGNPASTRRRYRSLRQRRALTSNFGDVVARDFHFHRAHLDFEMFVIDLAGDPGRAPRGFQLDRVAFGTCFTSCG